MSDPKADAEFFPIFEGATALVAKQLAFFRDEDAEPTDNEKLMAGHIVGNLCANGYTQLPGTVEQLRSVERDLIGQCATLRAALSAVAGFGDVNLSGEWEAGLRDIIRSMTDCAKNALNQQKVDDK